MKSIKFRVAEELEQETIAVEHGIYNSFGKMVDLPTTHEIITNEISFKPKELGDCFIELGEKIKRERHNIKNIELDTLIRERVDSRGKEFCVNFNYELEISDGVILEVKDER